jgi:hypothetical protein
MQRKLSVCLRKAFYHSVQSLSRCVNIKMYKIVAAPAVLYKALLLPPTQVPIQYKKSLNSSSILLFQLMKLPQRNKTRSISSQQKYHGLHRTSRCSGRYSCFVFRRSRVRTPARSLLISTVFLSSSRLRGSTLR